MGGPHTKKVAHKATMAAAKDAMIRCQHDIRQKAFCEDDEGLPMADDLVTSARRGASRNVENLTISRYRPMRTTLLARVDRTIL